MSNAEIFRELRSALLDAWHGFGFYDAEEVSIHEMMDDIDSVIGY